MVTLVVLKCSFVKEGQTSRNETFPATLPLFTPLTTDMVATRSSLVFWPFVIFRQLPRDRFLYPVFHLLLPVAQHYNIPTIQVDTKAHLAMVPRSTIHPVHLCRHLILIPRFPMQNRAALELLLDVIAIVVPKMCPEPSSSRPLLILNMVYRMKTVPVYRQLCQHLR